MSHVVLDDSDDVYSAPPVQDQSDAALQSSPMTAQQSDDLAASMTTPKDSEIVQLATDGVALIVIARLAKKKNKNNLLCRCRKPKRNKLPLPFMYALHFVLTILSLVCLFSGCCQSRAKNRKKVEGFSVCRLLCRNWIAFSKRSQTNETVRWNDRDLRFGFLLILLCRYNDDKSLAKEALSKCLNDLAQLVAPHTEVDATPPPAGYLYAQQTEAEPLFWAGKIKKKWKLYLFMTLNEKTMHITKDWFALYRIL